MATSRAPCDVVGIWGNGFVSAARRPAVSIDHRIRFTASLITLSGSSPFFTMSASALKLRPLGISISLPAFSAAALCTPPQSDITKPLNPKSLRSTSVRMSGFSEAYVPLTLL